MITAIWAEHTLTAEGELGEDQVAVFDREWAPSGRSTAVPALVFGADEGVAAGAAALAAIAHEAVATATGDSVEVTGSGLIAAEARRLLRGQGRLALEEGPPPTAAIETTGAPGAVADATRSVRDMGTIALAGEPLARAHDLDLYADVHVRGLTLIGIPRVQSPAGASPGHARHGLQELRTGEALDGTALWYCVTSPSGA